MLVCYKLRLKYRWLHVPLTLCDYNMIEHVLFPDKVSPGKTPMQSVFHSFESINWHFYYLKTKIFLSNSSSTTFYTRRPLNWFTNILLVFKFKTYQLINYACWCNISRGFELDTVWQSFNAITKNFFNGAYNWKQTIFSFWAT